MEECSSKVPLLSFCDCPAVQCPTQESGMHLCEEDRRGVEWEEPSSCVNELNKQHSSSLLLCLIGSKQLDPGTVGSPLYTDPLRKGKGREQLLTGQLRMERSSQDLMEACKSHTQLVGYKAYLTMPIGFTNWGLGSVRGEKHSWKLRFCFSDLILKTCLLKGTTIYTHVFGLFTLLSFHIKLNPLY